MLCHPLLYQQTKGISFDIHFYCDVYDPVQYPTGLEGDPWIARILAQSTATSSSQINAYRLRNVGGFEFSYMMGIITLCFVWLALNAPKRWVKVAGVLLTILGFYYILQCQYTTLLLLTFLGTVLLLFRRAHSWKVRILLVIGCIALVIGFVPLLYYLSELFTGSLLSSKFFADGGSVHQPGCQ